MTEEMYSKILWEGYGLRYHGGTRTRTGLVCKTDCGLWELKKARSRKAEIKFAHDVKTCLYQNGFTQLCLFEQTTNGQPYFEMNGTVYLLEKCMTGTVLEEETTEDFVAGAALIGKMHRCAKGFYTKQQNAETPTMVAQWQKRWVELLKIKRRIEKQGSYSALDLLILKHYQTFSQQAKKAVAILQQEHYTKLWKLHQKEGTFCHNRVKGSNLYRQADGQLFIGGFEHCTADSFLLDLASYLRRFWRKTDRQKDVLTRMLAAYQMEKTLSNAEKQALYPLTVYPEKFFRLMHEYYNKRQVCVSPAMLERLAVAGVEEEQMADLWEILENIW